MCLTIKHIISEGYFTRKCVSFHKLPQGTLFLLKEKKKLTLETQWNLDMKRLFSSLRMRHNPQYSCISYESHALSIAHSWDKRAKPSYSNTAQVFQIHGDLCSSFTSLKDRLRLVHLKIDLISIGGNNF